MHSIESKTLAPSGTEDLSPGFLAVMFKREALSKIQFLSHARQKKKKIAQEKINSFHPESGKKFLQRILMNIV